MNILLITHIFVGFMVYEIPRVSVFGHCSYSVNLPYIYTYIVLNLYILSITQIYIYIPYAIHSMFSFKKNNLLKLIYIINLNLILLLKHKFNKK